MYKKYVILLLIIGLLFSAGCGWFDRKQSGENTEAVAIQYITDLLNHNWEAVISRSTGEQLSNLIELLPTLKAIEITADVRKIEAIGKDESKDGNIAFVTVLAVRNVNLEGFGSSIDEQQILVSMKEIDGKYMVYRLDNISNSNIKK